MTTSEPQTRYTYRLLDSDHETLEERELPTDGEALTWAEEVRGRTSGLVVRRVERRTDSGWVPVSEAGAADQDRSSEDL
jgi:hypothetical protein